MNINEYLEKWGRTLFEVPLASRPGSQGAAEEPEELAEIRLAVLDKAREKSYRSGGKKVFPYDLLRIELRGVEEGRQGIFSGRFFRQYLEQELRLALRNSGCRFPEDLRVDVETRTELPLRGQPWLVVEVALQERAGRSAVGKLLVREGTANTAEVRLDKARTNIGRVVDVYRAEGLFRRNDLAFAEDTEINRSVSREHAHIRYDRVTGEYRLFNDRWYPRPSTGECGTWIVRDGMSQEVHRTSRGTKLEPGDEIHFGRAVVEFALE
ncbi:MAG TPA: FHA domain-containing protein [Bryobacteraceae bacterium]|nr:FHA domain-containing protein [Bryobacteraceae bacterium]